MADYIARHLLQDYSAWPIEQACSRTSARLKFEVLDPARKVRMRFESAGQVVGYMHGRDPEFKTADVYASTTLSVSRKLAVRLEEHGWVRRVPAGGGGVMGSNN